VLGPYRGQVSMERCVGTLQKSGKYGAVCWDPYRGQVSVERCVGTIQRSGKYGAVCWDHTEVR
jgi:hypothetical protein